MIRVNTNGKRKLNTTQKKSMKMKAGFLRRPINLQPDKSIEREKIQISNNRNERGKNHYAFYRY